MAKDVQYELLLKVPRLPQGGWAAENKERKGLTQHEEHAAAACDWN